jgi:hypothetical protein
MVGGVGLIVGRAECYLITRAMLRVIFTGNALPMVMIRGHGQ